MDRTTYIYKLKIKGEDHSTFYIGVTVDPKRRLKAHLTEHTRESYKDKLTYKHLKVRSILRAGKEVEMKIIKEFPSEEEAYENEQKYIQEYLDHGYKLVNTATGGIGGGLVRERNMSDETRNILATLAKRRLHLEATEEEKREWKERRTQGLREKSKFSEPRYIHNIITGEYAMCMYPHELRNFAGSKDSTKLNGRVDVRFKNFIVLDHIADRRELHQYDRRYYRIDLTGQVWLHVTNKGYSRGLRRVRNLDYDNSQYLIFNNPKLKIYNGSR